MTTPNRPRKERPNPEPNIVLVGSEPACTSIERALDKIDASFRRVTPDGDPVAYVDQGTVAVISAESSDAGEPARRIEDLRGALDEEVAIVTMVPDESDDRQVRALYGAGAAIVFRWPRESPMVGPVLAETLALRLVRGPAAESDRALARVVKAHCRALAPPATKLDVTGHDGSIELRGEVEALWQKAALRRRAGEVPGVTGVLVHDLSVAPTKVPDQQVEAAVEGVLAGVTEHTVAVSVSRGRVTLAGSVPSNAESRRLLELVMHVRGVREIENLMVVDPTSETDRDLAARVREALQPRFPQLDIDVVTFGGNVVLSATVQTMATKWDLVGVVEDLRGVRHVVDKVYVSDGG